MNYQPSRRALTVALCFVILHSSFVILPAADNAPPASAPDLRTLLRDALFEEEATRDLNKAATGYEELLTKWAEQRQFAAAALFRLAEVRRKQDRKDDAVKLYQRLLAEFSDVDPHARLSRENLTALGAKEPAPTTPAAPAVGDEEAAALARVQKLAVESPDLLSAGELETSCIKGWLSVVKFLHSKGVKDDVLGLDYAAAGGHLSVCEEMLTQDPLSPPHASLVQTAVREERIAVLKLFLDKGAKPDGPPDTATPPLTIALQFNNEASAELLLARQANPNPAKADTAPLFAAAAWGNAPMVQRLLELGADPRNGGLNPSTEPPKRQTAGGGARRVLAGEDKGLATGAGSTPLHAAVWRGNAECVSLLLKAKADPNAANEAGWTPLHGAAKRGDAVMIELLLAAGARPDSEGKSSEGKALRTPLMFAAIEGRILSVAALLKAKADANREAEGTTAIGYAMNLSDAKPRDEIVTLLLAHGADPAAGGRSAIDYAPPALKVKLLRGYQYPKLAAKPEVALVFGDEARESVLAPRRAPDEKPAPLPALLLAWHDRGGWNPGGSLSSKSAPDWSTVRLFRKGGDGKITETVLPIKAGADFPALLWGDIIEVVSKDGSTSPQPPQPGRRIPRPDGRVIVLPTGPASQSTTTGLPPETVAILRDTQTAHIKLTADGVTRELTLRGSLRTWNPLANEAPLVPLSILAGWCGANSTRFATTVSVRLRRAAASGGGDGVYLSTDGTLASLMPRDGDEITILDPKETDRANSFPRIGYHSPQQPFGGMIVPAQGGNTLFQLLAELYAAPPAGTWPADAFNADGTPADPATLAEKLTDRSLRFHVLPHPDFSRIRVTRSNEHTDYDLVKAAAALPANAIAEDARKFDVVLLDIDHVEIPVLPDASKPFTALPEKVERLLSLALSCRVSLDDQKGDLRAMEVQWLPARYLNTPAGLLPIPAPSKNDGITRLPVPTSAALAAALFDNKYITTVDRAEKHLAQEHAGWLREGDRITLHGSQQNILQPNFRGPGLPPSPPLPANTTRVP